MSSSSFHRRILLVEDDESYLMCLAEQLRELGHDVALARSGIECLHELRRELFDVVVLDQGILWGGGDGILDACRIEYLHVPELIVLTSGSDNSPANFGFPIAHELHKPIDADDVVFCIESLICKIDWFCC